jgi:hypothetical protein
VLGLILGWLSIVFCLAVNYAWFSSQCSAYDALPASVLSMLLGYATIAMGRNNLGAITIAASIPTAAMSAFVVVLLAARVGH